jgi:hypothetical protein
VLDAAGMVESMFAVTRTAIWNGTSGTMIADMRSSRIAAGMKTVKVTPATIEAIVTNDSLPDLRPCRHDGSAGERARAMNGAAL